MHYWLVYYGDNCLYEVTTQFGELSNGLYAHDWHVYTFGKTVAEFTFGEIKDVPTLAKFGMLCDNIEFGINKWENDLNGGSKPLNNMDDAAQRYFRLHSHITSALIKLTTEFPQLTFRELEVDDGGAKGA